MNKISRSVIPTSGTRRNLTGMKSRFLLPMVVGMTHDEQKTAGIAGGLFASKPILFVSLHLDDLKPGQMFQRLDQSMVAIATKTLRLQRAIKLENQSGPRHRGTIVVRCLQH